MTTNNETLKAKFAEEKKQLLARQKAEKAKFSKAASKQLNRKKIILGSVILKRIEANAKNVVEFAKAQLSTLSDKDKALFPELFAITTPEPNKQ
jgi:hypothetical protein